MPSPSRRAITRIAAGATAAVFAGLIGTATLTAEPAVAASAGTTSFVATTDATTDRQAEDSTAPVGPLPAQQPAEQPAEAPLAATGMSPMLAIAAGLLLVVVGIGTFLSFPRRRRSL